MESGGFCFLLESGEDSPFFMDKSLEISGFFREKIIKKSFFWGCFFVTGILQCG